MHEIAIDLPDGGETSGLFQVPEQPRAGLVLAHGAGAGMRHPFLAGVAAALFAHGIASLRFDFPYMHRGAKVPDRPPAARATARAAAGAATRLLPGVPLFAGGKSFGARMTSAAQTEQPLPGVRGLVFFGFPLHPAGKPSTLRAEHLRQIDIPMLFLQGTRDALADLGLLEPVLAELGPLAKLVTVPGADHSFHVPAKSGRTDAAVLAGMMDVVADWILKDERGRR